MPSDSTLLFTPDRARHFLVPEGVELAEGDLLLKNPAGKELRVAETAVAEHEISKEQAREWLKSQLGKVLSEGRERLQGALEAWRRPVAPAQPADPGAAGRLPPGRGLTLLGDLTGTAPEALAREPGALKDALGAWLGDMARLGAGALSPDPEKRAEAEARRQELRATLAQHGIELPAEEPAEPKPEGESEP